MNADFSNVFFAADVDGQIKLDYWRESYNSSSAATFWVKTNVPSAGTTFYAHVSPAVTYSGSLVKHFYIIIKVTILMVGLLTVDVEHLLQMELS